MGQPRYCRQKLSSDLLLRSDLSRVLVVGDAQYETGTLAQFQQSFHPSWGRVKPLISPVPGNHEYYTPGAAGYYDYFNGPGAATGPAGDRDKGYYSYEIGGWHVVALNSQCDEIGGCDPDSPQARWLRADLATHRAPCTLAYWHGPRYTSGRYGNQSEDVRPLFDAAYAAGVDVVLSGHEHFYERFAPQDGAGRADPARGVRQFTVGMGGRGPHGFVTVAPNSEFRTVVGDRCAGDDARRGHIRLAAGPGALQLDRRLGLGTLPLTRQRITPAKRRSAARESWRGRHPRSSSARRAPTTIG